MPFKRKRNGRTRWVAQVRRGNHKVERVFSTQKEAKNFEAEMRKLPDEELIKQIITVCLIDWANKYLDYAKLKFSKSTFFEKKSMYKKRFFKSIDPSTPVEKLTSGMVLSYLQQQYEKRSGYAANKDRKNLVAAWNWGMKYMSLPGPNPCIVEKMPEVRKPRYIPPEEDFWKVYEEAEGQDKVMLLTFLHTAARRGEVFRIKLSDLDFDNSRVRLWTCKRAGGNLEPDWLPMTEELKKSLMWWLEARPIQDSEYVFLCLDKFNLCSEHYGQPFQYRQKFMAKLCKKAKVKSFGFHALRHLSGTLLYKHGQSVAIIQAILRHKSPNTTELYLKSLGLENVREALEGLTRKKGKVLEFDRQSSGDKIVILKERAV